MTDPDNNQINITINSVTQDEPVNGLGDGDSSPDAVIQDGDACIDDGQNYNSQLA